MFSIFGEHEEGDSDEEADEGEEERSEEKRGSR
jgi:hypothetical protein